MRRVNAFAYDGTMLTEERSNTNRIAPEVIGESPRIQAVMQQIEIVGSTDSTVLILGETGTGKSLFANLIHNLSARRNHNW